MSGSEGHAVVAADVGGKTALFKKLLKYSESVVFRGRRKSLTSEEKATGVVRDGELAALVTSEQELTLVIDAPQLVGLLV